MSLGLILFTSCSKDESNDLTVEQTADSIYLYSESNGRITWESINPNNLTGQSTVPTEMNRGNSAHTHGDYYSTSGGTTISWSGTENNGGTHGSAFLRMGPSELTLETECIMVEGNAAVYGGIITEVTNPSGPLAIGSYVFFRVTDNGQGNNADPDQFNSAILVSPNNLCGVATPSWFLWAYFAENDVLAPGSVKVNN